MKTATLLLITHLLTRLAILPACLICVLPLPAQNQPRRQPMALELTSTVFQEGQSIPPVYTADGLNKSPPLKWSEPPAGTKALALVCEDPDAPKGTFTHWVAFNIPPESRELGEDMPKEQELANGT